MGRTDEKSSDPQPARVARVAVDRLQWGRTTDWAQLVRLPTVFTLLSNSLAAAIVAVNEWQPWSGIVPTLLASLSAYWAGMILNDVVDLDEDIRDRPHRPLAAGRISPVIAGHVATALLLLCPILILAVTALHPSQPLWQGAAFLSAVLLSLCVRAYDSPLKRTPVGPLLMGGCRALNILMVGFTMFSLGTQELFPHAVFYLALGIGMYIVGVTVFARHEEMEASSSGNLIAGMLLEIAGLIVIARLPDWAGENTGWSLDPSRGYPLLIGLIGLTVINRSIQGIAHPVSRKVQLAVKHALLTLILIDAAIALMWAGVWYGCAVVALLLPAMAIAFRFRTT